MNNKRILVVEDDGIISKDISRRITALGYTVTGIETTGGSAVESAMKERPDLVLMDIMLKGPMDGIEAAGEIHASLDIPVIYLTALADEKNLDRVKKTGSFGYLMKPVDDNALRFTIEMALYRHEMEMERERLLLELQEALAKIRTLRGLLPICAWCKRIRDDKGYWNQVEAYISEHSEVDFTHSICPECSTKITLDTDSSNEEE
jgi:CheY-like chemotaxis protein